MIYLFLIIIISLLIYIAFFTPEKRDRRNIKRVQDLFNTSLKVSPEEQMKFEISFMESCEEKTSKSNCVCTYNYLKNTLGFESFYADSNTFAQTGILPERLEKAMGEAKIHCTK